MSATSNAGAEAGIEWEHTPCPHCASDAAVRELQFDLPGAREPVSVVRCRSCSLAYLDPRPTPETIGACYPADYECYRPGSSSARKRLRHRLEGARLRVRHAHPGPRGLRDRIASFLAGLLVRRAINRSEWIDYRGSGNLLDVGCGAGDFLTRMRDRGWDVEGVDIGAEHCDEVSRAVGAPVHAGRLPEAELGDRAYDLITFWQVLEHLHDPVETLRAARSRLREGGAVVASTPNFGSWSRRRFGHSWIGLDPPRHLVHYTPESLRMVFETAGFAVTRVVSVGMDGWIRRSAAESAPGDRWRRAYTWKPLAARTARWTERRGTADNILIEAVPSAAAARHPTPLRRAA